MNPSFRLLAVGASLALGHIPGLAQNVLIVDNNGRPAVVERFREAIPLIRDGKQGYKAAPSLRYALKKVDGYRTAFVAVRNVKMTSNHSEVVGDVGVNAFNHELRFEAELESAEDIEHAFVVLELHSRRFGKSYAAHQVGPLKGRRPKQFRFVAPVSTDSGEGKFALHLFADGYEIFHSKLPVGKMDAALDAGISKRLAEVEAAALEPYLQTAPEYPASLLADAVGGNAIVAFTVDSRGRVKDPVVESASQPPFGEAALAAVREWRFLPQVVAGKPVATQVRMPLVFQPPESKTRIGGQIPQGNG